MARGNIWEMTYDPAWEGPTTVASLATLDSSSGLVDCKIDGSSGTSVTVRWKVSGPKRVFQRCDFAVTVTDSLISNCEFKLCRFRGSKWDNVKFSNCQFTQCDFSEVSFQRCFFVSDCHFDRNSASAELFRITDTAISAKAFMSGLETNVDYGGDKKYQQYRFIRTREKIAKALYSATRNESELDYYFEAYEELSRCSMKQRVETYRYGPDNKTSRRWAAFVLLSLPARTERTIVLFSGWLTEWGRSLLRPFLFFLFTVVCFTLIYIKTDPRCLPAFKMHTVATCAIKAINITLVAGYTAHFDSTASIARQLISEFNLTLGIFWYSLIVPVISKRVLR